MSQPLSQYEQDRLMRIAENAKRMRELGVLDAAKEVQQQASTLLRVSQQFPRKKRAREVVEVELRRSNREGKKEVNYNERDIFKAEEALARAEAKSRIVIVRRIKHEQATGRAYVSRKAGWRPDQGMAGHAACERCLEAAEEHAEGLPNPAFCKVLSSSMVSGGFWMEQPRGLREAVGVDDRCNIAAFIPEGQQAPPEAEYAQQHDSGGTWWPMVWLPRKSGAGFSGGWRGFALDHELFPGDVVVVETRPGWHSVPGVRFSIVMHVFRALDYETEGARQARLQQLEAAREATAEREQAAAAEGGDPQQAAGTGEQAVAEEADEPQQAAAAEAAEERAAGGGSGELARGSSEAAGPTPGAEWEEAGQQPVQQLGAAAAPAAQEALAGLSEAEPEAKKVASQEAGDQSQSGAKRRRQAVLSGGERAAKRQQRGRVPAGSPAAAQLAVHAGSGTGGKPAAGSDAAAGLRKRRQRSAASLGQAVQEKAVAAAAKKASAAAARAPKQSVKQARQRQSATLQQQCQPLEEEEEEVYDVESIVGMKGSGRSLMLEIKWVGYQDTTWEPFSMLDQPLHTYVVAPAVLERCRKAGLR